MRLVGVFNRISKRQNQKREQFGSKRAEGPDGRWETAAAAAATVAAAAAAAAAAMLVQSSYRPRRAEPGKGCEAGWS